MAEVPISRPSPPRPEEYVVCPARRAREATFAISVGLREGWDAEGRVFDVSEAVRTAFLRGIGAVELTRTSTWPFGNTPSNPKPSLLQRLRNLASLSRPLPREERRAASQTS